MRKREYSLSKTEKIDNYLTIGLIVFMLITFLLLFVYRQMRLENSTTETISCEVIDKYYENRPRYKEHKYYIVVSFENDKIGHAESEIAIPLELFKTIHSGDKVLCEVIYDTTGIIEIKIVGET